MRDGPTGRSTKVDGPTDLVRAKDDCRAVMASLKGILAICLYGSLVKIGRHVKVPLEQDIGPQLEPDIVAIQNENQIIFLANGLQPLEIGQQCFDLCEMLLVGVGLFVGAPVDQDRSGVFEDGRREEELAKVAIATCCGNEVVKTSFGIARRLCGCDGVLVVWVRRSFVAWIVTGDLPLC
jgi:hypothetical protein